MGSSPRWLGHYCADQLLEVRFSAGFATIKQTLDPRLHAVAACRVHITSLRGTMAVAREGFPGW